MSNLTDTEDVFISSSSSASPAIVDFATIEAAKENIQPLASGRRATALANVLSKPLARREAALASARSRLRSNIQLAMEDYDAESTEDGDGDPLDAYTRLINWTLENYPEGQSAASNLLPLLEEATRVLKDHADGHWRGDARYLRLWSLYAGYIERPEIVWRFLLANDIGTGWAAMYESFAGVLEELGRTKEADEIYLLGIARNADPIARLKAKHDEFQRRVLASALAGSAPAAQKSNSQVSSAVASAPAPAPTAAPKRKVLGDTSKKSSSSSAPPPPAAGPSRPNARLQVFVDDASPDSPALAAASSLRTPGPPTNVWSDLGTRATRVKENTKEVSKFAGTTIKQPGAARRIAASNSRTTGGTTARTGFQIFVDEDGGKEQSMPPPPAPPIKKKASLGRNKQDVEERPAARDTRSTSGSAMRGGFTIFTDEDAENEAAPSQPVAAPTKKKLGKKEEVEEQVPSPQTPSKPKSVPFVDEPSAQASAGTAFKPFRDESAPSSPRAERATPAPASVMQPKVPATPLRAAGSLGDLESAASEAEALRKDPLKNYNL